MKSLTDFDGVQGDVAEEVTDFVVVQHDVGHVGLFHAHAVDAQDAIFYIDKYLNTAVEVAFFAHQNSVLVSFFKAEIKTRFRVIFNHQLFFAGIVVVNFHA